MENGISRTINLDNPESISPEDVERLSNAFGWMLGKDKPAENPKADNSQPTPDKFTTADLVSMGKVLEGDEENLTPEDIEKFSKAIGKMWVAEMRGEDIEASIDPDEFVPAVTDSVAEAIKNYSETENVDLTMNLNAEKNKIVMLFHPKKPLEANNAYRALVREGHYRFVGNENVFSKHRGYHGVIDKDTIERLLRRVDVEVRNMETLAREELLFNFVNAVLGSDLATNYGVFVSTDQFSQVSPESQDLLRDLVLMYMDARDHARVSLKGYDKVNKDFDTKSVYELTEIPLSKFGDYPVRVEYAQVARTIRPKNYYLILQLIRALNAALPAKVQGSVETVLLAEHNVTLNVTAINSRLLNPSKYLRKAFIAISRGHGTFEAFFTALFDFQTMLDNDLNNKVKTARFMVSVYDSLGLDIAAVLKSSMKRILEEPPF
ncbi:hypothetical protein [Ralstonia phage RP31]|uniref:Uncharacterized protein n=2 Tax=Ripduovirus RP12 TaxID=2560700 RepID=A0A1L7N104_9CAUD|nr:hypothetical protein FDH28_gp233 [Ralstonia phage RP12]BAW19162.1 hypothetical protein [Ralstonia phage RP12]BAW19448.1 hypothetical protein [Ralstonia phage RP31]